MNGDRRTAYRLSERRMMSRYIDADALLKGRQDHEMISTHLIWNAPTADVVEVTRCKDCIHGIPTRIDTVTGEFSDERYCNRHHMCHSEDYYCADGKRTENAMKCEDCKNYGHWFGDNYRCADSGTMVSENDICPY